MHNLVLLISNGDGINKDIDKAIYWYEKSSEQDLFMDLRIFQDG